MAALAAKLSARLAENLSEAARDLGLNVSLDTLSGAGAASSGAGKYLEPGALATDESVRETKKLLSSNKDRERDEGLRRVLAVCFRFRCLIRTRH